VLAARRWHPAQPAQPQRDSILREAEGSLRRLGVDAIDLYQIHWPIPDEDIEEGWSAMAELKERGAWTLRNPAVDGAIAGFRRPAQVDPVLDAAASSSPART
jgi:aryl-alcohol dehydrogenase-like predicted oxidoreductase